MKHRSLRHLDETVAARIREERFRDVWKAAGLSPYFQAIDALLSGSPVTWTKDGGVIVDLRTGDARETILREPIDLCPTCWATFQKVMLGKTE